MSGLPRVAIAVLLTAGVFNNVSAQQNTPQVRKPPEYQYVPPSTGPSDGSKPVVSDACVNVAKNAGELARLKEQAIAGVKGNGGDMQAFLSNIPGEAVAQCRYYTNVIGSYR